jgi:hypothetical protein
MTNWHLAPDSGRHQIVEDAYKGFSITTGASSAKSSWGQLITTTPFDYYGFYFTFLGVTRAAYQYTFDIGIGVASSEKPLVEEIPTPFIRAAGHTDTECAVLYFPFFIPAGSNLHGRGRSNYTSEEVGVLGGIHGIVDNPFFNFSAAKSQTLNVDTSGPYYSRNIDPGGTANTWGSWADVSDGPMTLNAKAVLIITEARSNGARTTCDWRVQLGVGGSGNEQSILEIARTCDANSDYVAPPYEFLPVNIPASTTLRHRAMCSITDATDRQFGITYVFFE